MAALIQALLDGLTPIWTWVTTTFVPATAADVTLIHLAMWSGFLFAMASAFLGLVFRRGRR
jgi:hypothetical protein